MRINDTFQREREKREREFQWADKIIKAIFVVTAVLVGVGLIVLVHFIRKFW